MKNYSNNGDMTKCWELYEAGKKYNNSVKPNYYDTVAANRDFFTGNQWRNLEGDELPKPVFNIIKRVITFFIASLTSTGQAVQFSPLEYNENNMTDQMQQEQNAADIANAEIENLFEKFKMSNRTRDALFSAGVDGDVAAHYYFDTSKKPYRGRFPDIQGEICMELVRGESVFFGNANIDDKELQPYIIVSGRDMVESLKEEAKKYKENSDNVIDEDSEYMNANGEHNIELEADNFGKATYIIVYKRDKKTNKIKVSKSVQNAYIYKDIDTGLDYYPIAWLPWEKQYNSYHGRAICTGLIPNQIFINRMFAMVMYHLMMTAFPKAVYNAQYINGWTNEIGVAIPVNNMQAGENIKNIAGYLEPGNMSSQIMSTIDMAWNYTKESLGVNDSTLGSIDPKQASGVAIQAVQRASAVPLENPKANMQEWLEDSAKILLDMMGTYYGERPIVYGKDGVKQSTMFDFSVFKDMWLSIAVDVGDASFWSEIAQTQTLDALKSGGIIDAIQYLERVPDKLIPKKAELIKELKENMAMMAQQQQMQQGIPPEGQPEPANNDEIYEQMAQFLESLPEEAQQEIMSLPEGEQEQALMQLMEAN